jgi:hypothetical protein
MHTYNKLDINIHKTKVDGQCRKRMLFRGRVCQIFLGATYQNGKNRPNDHKIGVPNGRMSIKYTNISHCKTLQNVPELGFLVWKCTICQPCFVVFGYLHCNCLRRRFRIHCNNLRRCFRIHCNCLRRRFRIHCNNLRRCFRTHCNCLRRRLRIHCNCLLTSMFSDTL